MNTKILSAKALALSAVLVGAVSTNAQVTLFSEDFESLASLLGPIETFDSELRESEAWTETPPDGWTVDDSGVPTVGDELTGVVEFEGWSFVDRDWWIATAGDQERSQFIGGSGVVAVADPDEWDDFGNPSPSGTGFFDAKLTTPSIDLTAAPIGDDIKIAFNSSWRPEVEQKATLTATFNDGANTEIELLRYESEQTLEDDTPNPAYQGDTPNETVVIPLTGDFAVPSGATEVSLEFRLFDAGNNWWWAFDNLQVFTGEDPPGIGALSVQIDRDTSNVKIINNTDEPIDIRGYSITSDDGVFDEGSASFLAPADNWLTATSTDDEANDLSELNLTADTIAAGEEIDLGDVWRKYYQEEGDVDFEYLVAGNDSPIPGSVEFIGNNDEEFAFLDLNFDGDIDIADWDQFKSGFGKSLTGLTAAQQYALSDLNGDGRHTAEDFLVFQGTFDAVNGAGAFEAALAAVPEPGSVMLFAVSAAALATLRRRIAAPIAALAVAFVLGAAGNASAQLSLYFEDFDGGGASITDGNGINVVYGPFQEEDVPGQEVWSNTFPGWTTDNSNVPGVGILDIPGVSEAEGDDPTTDRDSDGVTDWSNWAFVDKSAWIAADDQGRSGFTRATGYVMVADSDEWDDADSSLRDPLASAQTPDDLYDVFATTPVINIPAGIPAGRITLSFDSSWRGDEFQDDLDGDNNESASIKAAWDGGTPNEVFRRESDPESDFYNPRLENERVTQIDLDYDGVSTELQLEFGMTGAWNDWWWAVDNIFVGVPSNPLKLRIDPDNGLAELTGDDTIASAIQFLEIKSGAGQLTGELATGLSGAGLAAADGPDGGDTAGDFPGEQWESLTDPSTADVLFAEAFLFGSTTFDNSVSVFLGQLFDTTTAEGDRDVSFRYTLNSGDVVVGTVEYGEVVDPSPILIGDADGDGDVDGDDLIAVQTNFGAVGASGLNGDADSDGDVDGDDLIAVQTNFGAVAPSIAVPEPGAATMIGFVLAGLAAFRSRRLRPAAFVALAGVTLACGEADAQVTLDRLYSFGDDSAEGAAEGGIVGAASGGATFDSEGQLGMNQLIDLVSVGTIANVPPANPQYVTITDRPDMIEAGVPSGLGVALNDSPLGSTFNQQYLHTGYTEALNYPERSPSSTFSPGGTINYDLISDRGFQLWTKPTPRDAGGLPTDVTDFGEQHIVMDSNQHGVLINENGEFAMRYAWSQDAIDQEAISQGVDPSELADLFDSPSGVVAQTDRWYHLSVVRPFGPGNGSILYIDGAAVAVATGEYNVEEVVNDDFGDPILTDLDTSPLVIGAKTGNPDFGDDNYYSGVVDDLEMFIMGINSENFFPDYVFENDNDYAAVFKPTIAGDVDGDNDVDLDDAYAFAGGWLYENRVAIGGPNGGDDAYLVIGDLVSRGKGDLNYDGIVDLEDWAILNNANPGVATGAARLIAGLGVPEPNTLMLLGFGTVLSAARRRR